MPGDGILGPGAGSTTRAVTFGAPAGQVWPWPAQLGYRRAGWYSNDWLDNDWQRSAEQIRPESYSAVRVRRTGWPANGSGIWPAPPCAGWTTRWPSCSATAHNERARRGAARTPGPVR